MRVSTALKAICLTMLVCAIVGEETQADKGSAIGYGADVRKVLDILINSLYTNRSVFLRELISNGSDAIDKIRFMYLTNPKEPKNAAGVEPTLDIRLLLNKEANTLTITDGGIGMTKENLESQLGSLGTSGTKKFLEGMAEKDENDANNFIGQFGVGFYSAFLVADVVRVASKHDDSDKQWVWESNGDGTYFIYEDPRGNTLGRGTEITLEMKKDAEEFLESETITKTIHQYSEFINFPIMMQRDRTERIKKEPEAGAEEAEKKPDEDGEVKDAEEDSDEDEEDDDDKYETRTITEWHRVNDNKPIWTRQAEDITKDEYHAFYKALTKDYDDPMWYTHFSAEGEVEFKSLLFVPSRAPHNVFDQNAGKENIRLYVRRVFITDEFKDLLPRYLSFIKGVVDSDDLPLNVSREVLQESRILKIIKKKLVRKALTMIQDIANEGKEEESEDDKDAEEKKEKKPNSYPKFWEEFGKQIRLGMIEDGTNRARLTKLLRYKSSKNEEEFTSLEEYVDRMPESQKDIYFIASDSIEKIKQTPFHEDAINNKVEVLYMTEAIDEFVVGHVADFAGKKLVNLAKEGSVGADKSRKGKKIAEKRKTKFKSLTEWISKLLGNKVQKVKLTQRTTQEAFIMAAPQHGVTPNMARIKKGETLGDNSGENVKGVLEVNHLHPLVDEISKRVKVDENDEVAKEMTLTLFDVASLQNGFEVANVLDFSGRVSRMMRTSVDISSDAALLVEDTTEYEVEIAEEEAAEEAKRAEEEAAAQAAEEEAEKESEKEAEPKDSKVEL